MRRSIEKIVRKHAKIARWKLAEGKEWSQEWADSVLDQMHSELITIPYFGHQYHQHFPWSFHGLITRDRPRKDFMPLCFCEEIHYFSPHFFHVTMVSCEKARVTLCINLKTFEVTKHPLGLCPNGEYRSADAS